MDAVPLPGGPITSASHPDFEIELDTNLHFFIIIDNGHKTATRAGVKGAQAHVFYSNVKSAWPQDPLEEPKPVIPIKPNQK